MFARGADLPGDGSNSGGTLLLHCNPSLVYSGNDIPYHCSEAGLTDCEGAVARQDVTSSVLFLLAAFHPAHAPRLSGLSFGIEYPPTVHIERFGECSDFASQTDQWPASGTGAALAWAAPQTESLVPCYWFLAYADEGVPARVGVIPHPIHGGYFADDAVPARLDEVAAFGDFGFFTDGHVACPTPPSVGACCARDRTCQLLSSVNCAQVGGSYAGAGVPCDPDPCPQPSAACCFASGDCRMMTADACAAAGGEAQAFPWDCSPDPCPTPPAGCCLPNGDCQLRTRADCDDLHGQWHWPQTCDPGPCPPPIGACCLPGFVCRSIPRDWCERDDGSFLGYATTCYPDPCPRSCDDPRDAVAQRPQRTPTRVLDANPFARGVTNAGQSGSNRGGTLFLHHDPSISYTDDFGEYCGATPLVDCQQASTRHDAAHESIVLSVIAAFDDESSPRLVATTFGLAYSDCVEIVDWGDCGDLEIHQTDWPQSRTGTAVAWLTPQTELLVEVYWFVAYTKVEIPEQVRLTPHPTDGAWFADDSIPPRLDPIAGLGAFGFFVPGSAPCPERPVVGACCTGGGGCRVLTATECQSRSGAYVGPGTTCDPNPCLACGGALRGAINPNLEGPFRSELPTVAGAKQVPLASGACGTWNLNSDGTFETAYAWQYGAVIPPDWGSFAECYAGSGATEVCSVILFLTQIGGYSGQSADVYVWEDDDGCPGNVVCAKPNRVPGIPAFWPDVSTHVIGIEGCCVDGDFWVGYWGRWPGESAAWYVAVDLNGFGGCPFTLVPPGVGLPIGWHHVASIWPEAQAIGIGVETNPCGGVGDSVTRRTTWGSIKSLFQAGSNESRR